MDILVGIKPNKNIKVNIIVSDIFFILWLIRNTSFVENLFYNNTMLKYNIRIYILNYAN